MVAAGVVATGVVASGVVGTAVVGCTVGLATGVGAAVVGWSVGRLMLWLAEMLAITFLAALPQPARASRATAASKTRMTRRMPIPPHR